jgi:hypothetical protein
MALDLLSRIALPKAVFIAGQFNPPERITPAGESVLNLRRLATSPGEVALFRTDLAGMDAVAHGALAASIGTSGAFRHFIPPGQKPFFSQPPAGEPPDFSPSLLVDDLVSFLRGSTLARRFRDRAAPLCPCKACSQRRISSFTGRDDHQAARHHNVAVWSQWLPGLAGPAGPQARQRYWLGLCRAGIGGHEVFDNMVQQPGAFVPPLPLQVWARAGPATVPPRRAP